MNDAPALEHSAAYVARAEFLRAVALERAEAARRNDPTDYGRDAENEDDFS